MEIIGNILTLIINVYKLKTKDLFIYIVNIEFLRPNYIYEQLPEGENICKRVRVQADPFM